MSSYFKKVFPYFSACLLTACASQAPLSILLSNNTNEINYGHSTKDYREVASCIEQFWLTRPILPPSRIIVYPTPLVRTELTNVISFADYAPNRFQVIKTENGTEIRHARAYGYIVSYASVAKGAIIKCSDSQKFTSLLNIDENSQLPPENRK